MNWLLIAVGGAVGSMSRFAMAQFVQKVSQVNYFPLGTFCVNMLGCFLIGIMFALADLKQVLSPELRMFLMVGFLGGFTTFSTYGLESFTLMREGQFLFMLLNLLGQSILGLVLVYLGYIAVRILP